MLPGTEDTRRTANVRPGGRSARVVTRVMEATAYELSRVGYAALRVEDVAARSGVNKTTIYRRWPTKAELVAATIGHPRDLVPVDTGSVRADLRASLLVGVNLSPSQRGILRVVQTERTVPEIDAVTRRMRTAIQRARIAMVERGIARGELPRGVDAKLIVDLVSAPVQKALLFNETLDESYIERVLDVVLSGAIAHASKPESAARRAVRKKR
jgi:AcrR family transcriptional regulator